MVVATPDVLDEVIDGLSLGLDGPSLVQVQGAADRLLAKLGVAYGEFDHAECWDLDAATSMTAWLRDRTAMVSGDAARVTRLAKRLRVLPVTAAAAVDGTLSGGQVRAIVANVTPRTVGLFADHEAEMVPTLASMPVADVAIAMQAWAGLAEDALDQGEAKEPGSSLHLSQTLEGRWRLDGGLDPLSGEILDTALRLAKSPDVEGEPSRSPGERRADALVDICSFFLENHEHPSSSRHRPHVNEGPERNYLGHSSEEPAPRTPWSVQVVSFRVLIVTLEDLEAGRGGECPDGTLIDGPSLASLVCHSVMHRVLMAGSVILDYGVATKTISANLYNAVVVRDRHCRFPGCDRPATWADVHHVVHAEDGGPTCPANCVLLCRRHHTRLHRKGWAAELKADGELVVTDPHGRVFTSHPPGNRPRPPPELFATA